jgi:TPP-dependent pyruvate/acetoin dehydrogenase alpha subunit
MGSKAFESPLMSHARMRAMYRALVEARVLGQRAGKGLGWPRGFEACWVGTAIDLKDGDLTSVDRGEWLVKHVRGAGARAAGEAASKNEVAKALKSAAARKKASSAAAMDRMLCAVGMAMAVKASGTKAVVMAYVANDAMTAPEWRRLLGVAMDGQLPLAFVSTPGRKAGVDVSTVVKKMGTNAIPVIPVDAGDVVAIYRVAQETLVRARADGGVAVIECVDCGVDPVKLMGTQLVKKKICTERWVAGVEPGFRATVAKV